MRVNEEKMRIYNEHEVKAILTSCGIEVPKGQLIEKEEDIDYEGKYPKVIKVCSSRILHKSDVGGVIVGIKNREELKEKYDKMSNQFSGESFLIEEMITDKGIEAIVGIANDANFGRYIMVGIGGVLAELYKDVSFRLLPIKRKDVIDMIEALKGKELFHNFRNVKVNVNAFYDLVENIANFGEKNEKIREMDLNPVFISDRAIVLDAKLIENE